MLDEWGVLITVRNTIKLWHIPCGTSIEVEDRLLYLQSLVRLTHDHECEA